MSAIHENDFKQLFDEQMDGLRRFVFYRVGNEELANDIAQDAFVKIWEKRESVVWATAAALLFTTANNLAMNHLNHQKVKLKFQKASKREKDEQNPHYLMETQEFEQKSYLRRLAKRFC